MHAPISALASGLRDGRTLLAVTHPSHSSRSKRSAAATASASACAPVCTAGRGASASSARAARRAAAESCRCCGDASAETRGERAAPTPTAIASAAHPPNRPQLRCPRVQSRGPAILARRVGWSPVMPCSPRQRRRPCWLPACVALRAPRRGCPVRQRLCHQRAARVRIPLGGDAEGRYRGPKPRSCTRSRLRAGRGCRGACSSGSSGSSSISRGSRALALALARAAVRRHLQRCMPATRSGALEGRRTACRTDGQATRTPKLHLSVDCRLLPISLSDAPLVGCSSALNACGERIAGAR